MISKLKNNRGKILILISLISKALCIPLIVLFSQSIEWLETVTSFIGIILTACMIPFAFLIAIFPTTVILTLGFAYYLMLICNVLMLIYLIYCIISKKEKLSTCILGFIFLFIPLVDTIYSIWLYFHSDKKSNI